MKSFLMCLLPHDSVLWMRSHLYICLQELQIGIALKDVSPGNVDRCIKNDHCGPTLLAWISDLLSSVSSKGGDSALTKTGAKRPGLTRNGL